MQRAKINAEISRLRGYIAAPSHCCGMSGFGLGIDDICPACSEPTRFAEAYGKKFRTKENKDWLSDENWPVLLCDMLSAGRKLGFHSVGGTSFIQVDNAKNAIRGSDVGEAVCLAWLIHMNPVCTCGRHWDSGAEAVLTDSYRCLLHHKVP